MSTTSEGCPTKTAHGTFCWNERLCWDVERAKKFYADAIGWTFTSMPTPTGETYWCAMQDGRPVAGLFTLTSPYFDGVPEGWMYYLAVDTSTAVSPKRQPRVQSCCGRSSTSRTSDASQSSTSPAAPAGAG